jgi:hypothetical protein
MEMMTKIEYNGFKMTFTKEGVKVGDKMFSSIEDLEKYVECLDDYTEGFAHFGLA